MNVVWGMAVMVGICERGARFRSKLGANLSPSITDVAGGVSGGHLNPAITVVRLQSGLLGSERSLTLLWPSRRAWPCFEGSPGAWSLATSSLSCSAPSVVLSLSTPSELHPPGSPASSAMLMLPLAAQLQDGHQQVGPGAPYLLVR